MRKIKLPSAHCRYLLPYLERSYVTLTTIVCKDAWSLAKMRFIFLHCRVCCKQQMFVIHMRITKDNKEEGASRCVALSTNAPTPNC